MKRVFFFVATGFFMALPACEFNEEMAQRIAIQAANAAIEQGLTEYLAPTPGRK